jgi:uncharacterized protein YdiU (UPF0061 family)
MKLKDIKLTNPYLDMPSLCFDKVNPSPLNHPFLIHANIDLAKDLNIDISELEGVEFVKLINGSFLLEGSEPFASCYAGHQFGYFVDRLGDGRAINIGTLNGYHLQLKGAGPTLYSRSGDGRAVLRSSIREYLMSEAMHGLGIPTTRALGLIGSKHDVYRETWEKGAIVLRVSPSWIRFGTLEYFAHNKKPDELKAVADYAINESYPYLNEEQNKYQKLFEVVVEKTAKLMAAWQSVGFNHGVMNTDNMSIAGLTIDYGPYAFLDDYDSGYICNHTDSHGRYSFGNQPKIGEWNLAALAHALAPLSDIEEMRSSLGKYNQIFKDEYNMLMNKKLGLDNAIDGDEELIAHLLGAMQGLSVDYTLFFRTLSRYDGNKEEILKLCLYHAPMNDWLDRYDMRLKQNKINIDNRYNMMLNVNPKFVLKNYILQESIDAANNGDFSIVEALFEIAQNPFCEHIKYEKWAGVTPEIYKNNKLSCSS